MGFNIPDLRGERHPRENNYEEQEQKPQRRKGRYVDFDGQKLLNHPEPLDRTMKLKGKSMFGYANMDNLCSI